MSDMGWVDWTMAFLTANLLGNGLVLLFIVAYLERKGLLEKRK